MTDLESQEKVLELLPDRMAGKLDAEDRAWLDEQIANSPHARAAAALYEALAERLGDELATTSVETGRQRVFAAIAEAQRAENAGEPLNFLELLPAYAAGTLPANERRRMDLEIGRSPQAAQAFALHRALDESLRKELAETSVEDNRAVVMHRIRTAQAQAAAAAAASSAPARRSMAAPTMGERFAEWIRSLARQRLAPVLLLLVTLEGGLLGWKQVELSELKNEMRGGSGFVSTKTVRIRLSPAVTADRFTKALVASAANVVRGPDQFGDYWVASSILSRQEMKDALVASGILSAPPVDEDNGP